MDTSPHPKPSLVTAIGIMTLVNGIFNIIWGVGIIGATGFLALICAAPIPLFPIVLGAFEIGYAMKLFSNPPQPVRPSPAIAWWEIAVILVGNVFSAVVGILVLVFYNDSIVKDYFARLNAPQTPPAPPVQPEAVPPLPVESTPQRVAPPVGEVPAWLKPDAPAVESPSTEAPAQPVEEEAPAKPKRPRKAAKK